MQSIIESALYKLRVININQINRFELNILLQATSYVDIILSSFYTRIKAICLWRGKRRNIYEREFINQKKNCDVLCIISNASRHSGGIRDETFAVRTLRARPKKFLSIRGGKTLMAQWIKSLDQDGTNIKFRRNLAL